jgi:hypothetical protein
MLKAGEWILSDQPVAINAGRRTVRLRVHNMGDRPIRTVPSRPWAAVAGATGRSEGQAGSTVRAAVHACSQWRQLSMQG